MFLIILDNAMKFSPHFGKVELVLSGNRVTISDQGPGIEPEDLPFIFERFYRVKSEENKTGTGLGLAIAKQIAERHNITIEVESEKEKGTKFHFVFL